MKMRMIGALLSVVATAVVVSAGAQAADRKYQAEATITSVPGKAVSGSVRFLQERNVVTVSVNLSGLTPGEHGFHIHEKGDCSASDFSSAGPHFNPTGESHGGPQHTMRHRGDLGNLTADAHGKVAAEFSDSVLSLHGEHSIIGRSVIVHAGKDDLVSQPAGNAGPREGCGVVRQVE